MRLRVITAAILLGFWLPAGLWLSPTWFMLAILVALAWTLKEWADLLNLPAGPRWAAPLFLLALLLPILLDPFLNPWDFAAWLLLPACLVWLLLMGVSMWRVGSPRGWMGLFYALLFCVACFLAIWLARLEGLGFLLSVLLLVWIADTAAYFSGRLIGGAKLAPRVSPGKTWAGVGGAMLGNLIYAWVSGIYWDASWAAFLLDQAGLVYLLVATVVITGISVVADLHQSLLKRQANVKDSGWILPGHGGVFDRVDALLAVVPFSVVFFAASMGRS